MSEATDKGSVESFLADHPWPDELRAKGEPLDVLWVFDLDTTPEALWSQIADTSRLNRALGLSEMRFEERDGKLVGQGVIAGVEQLWVEKPWSWVHGRLVIAERAYRRGLAHHVRVVYRLEPQQGGLRFWTYFGWIPRSWWSRGLLRLAMRGFRGRLQRLLGELAGAATGEEPFPLIEDPPRLAAEAQRRIGVMERRLRERGMNPEAVEALVEVVTHGDPADVARLQPRALAHRWQLPERDVLRCFLHATRVGLIDLSWDVICPHCRGVRQELKNLGEVPEGGSCEPCQIEFGTDGPNAIEVTFHVHPSLREVEKQMFCSAQTAAQRHIEIQQVLAPGQDLRVDSALGPGRYRLRLLGQLEVGYLDVADGEAASMDWRASAEAGEHRVGTSPTLRLVNDTEDEQIFIVEDVNWADEALKPAHLFSFQEFRDLFSEEYLGADVHLSVGEQTILFTDIVGSTALYLDRGDPEAFVAVRKHFTEIYGIVADHDGAVVKTIGDATMAAFGDAAQGLRAAAELQARFHPTREDTDIRIRVSVNTGVCIAVNLNSNIDYFGNTVNLAAKLQRFAGAGDVAFTEATRASPGVAVLLEERGAALEEIAFDFEAVGETFTVHRWALHDGEPSALLAPA